MAVRLVEIQSLRGIAIIAVVLIHTVSAFVFMTKINYVSATGLCIDVVCQFAVPLFFFISGFALALKSYSVSSFYWKRGKLVLPAYLVFSTLYALYYNKPIIASILLANAETHLQFLKVLMILYLLYPLIIVLFDFYDIFLFMLSIVLAISPLPALFSHLYFLYSLPYFLAGIYVSKNYDFVKERIEAIDLLAMVLLMLSLLILESFNWFSRYFPSYGIHSIVSGGLFTYLLSFLSFILVYRAAVRLPLLSSIGNYSFGIYLIHQFFMSEMRQHLYSLKIYYTAPIYYILLFVLAFSLSYLAAYLWSKANREFRSHFPVRFPDFLHL